MHYTLPPIDGVTNESLARNISRSAGIPLGWYIGDGPYVEANGPGYGPVVRRLTHLPEPELDAIVHAADAAWQFIANSSKEKGE